MTDADCSHASHQNHLWSRDDLNGSSLPQERKVRLDRKTIARLEIVAEATLKVAELAWGVTRNPQRPFENESAFCLGVDVAVSEAQKAARAVTQQAMGSGVTP